MDRQMKLLVSGNVREKLLTDRIRRLKVVFVRRADGVHLKTAFEPTEVVARLYEHHAGRAESHEETTDDEG